MEYDEPPEKIQIPPQTHLCDRECRIVPVQQFTTLAYFPPIYDKHGNNVNLDTNTVKGRVWCMTCNQSFEFETTLGKTIWK